MEHTPKLKLKTSTKLFLPCSRLFKIVEKREFTFKLVLEMTCIKQSTALRDHYSDTTAHLNPLPDMPILGSSNSAAIKNMMSKIWTNGVQLSD